MNRQQAKNFVREYGEKALNVPQTATLVIDTRKRGIGYCVYQNKNNDIWFVEHTGSDVPEWATITYFLAETEDVEMAKAQGNSNDDIVNALTPKKSKVTPDYPEGRKLDCGCTVYFGHEAMTTSAGTSCARCYDRMSA